jgi:hypothetical protein
LVSTEKADERIRTLITVLCQGFGEAVIKAGERRRDRRKSPTNSFNKIDKLDRKTAVFLQSPNQTTLERTPGRKMRHTHSLAPKVGTWGSAST